jgi:hypothetical protein
MTFDNISPLLKVKDQGDFSRKASLQSHKNNNTWAWAFPKEQILLNGRKFLIVTQTYFRVKQTCLEELIGLPIKQKVGGGKEDMLTKCDPMR